MKTKDAISHFGTAAAVAAAARISRAAVVQWGDLVPLGTAAVLEKMSGGQLRLNHSDYRRGRPQHPAPDAKAAP